MFFVSKNGSDENRPKFRGKSFTYKPGNKKFGGGAGIWTPDTADMSLNPENRQDANIKRKFFIKQ
jgi:hypothetical protein